MYNSFKTYTTTAVVAAQLSTISPLGPLGNVDVRNLSNGPATSLTEAGGEEDDEQNCPPSSGTLGSSQVGEIYKLLYSLLLRFSQSGTGVVDIIIYLCLASVCCISLISLIHMHKDQV